MERRPPRPNEQPIDGSVAAPRRLTSSRLVAAAALAAVALAVAGALGAQGLRAIVERLHAQPIRRLAFRDIQLSPEPPAWIKPRRVGMLEQVRAKSGLPETLSVLDQDLTALTHAFRDHSPWVQRVLRIERAYPNRLTVHLQYRRPVARVDLYAFDKHILYILAEDGVVLPNEEVDREAAGFLYQLQGLDAIGDARPGHPLLFDSASEEAALADRRIESGCRLAAFLKRQTREVGPRNDPLRLGVIRPEPDRGLFVTTAGDEPLVVHWGEAPGAESPGGPTADEKWAMLADWFRAHPTSDPKYPDYLEFSRAGAVSRKGVLPTKARTPRDRLRP